MPRPGRKIEHGGEMPFARVDEILICRAEHVLVAHATHVAADHRGEPNAGWGHLLLIHVHAVIGALPRGDH